MSEPGNKVQRLFGDIIAEREPTNPARPEPAAATVTQFRPLPTCSQSTNPFDTWWALGYRELLPIIPPKSTLRERTHLRPGDIGKTPGFRDSANAWGAFKGWRTHAATDADRAEWFGWGASVGLRRGAVLMLDIDAYDEKTADRIEAIALDILGSAPMRVGQWPKRALLYRAVEEIVARKLIFDGPGGKSNQIEMPAQMVVHGVHNTTGRLYEWRRPVVPFAELSPVTNDQLDALLSKLAGILPKAERVGGTAPTDLAAVDQQALKGPPEVIADIMRSLPNTRETFPTYESMRDVGIALHAALADFPELGRELWHEWSEKWEGGDYNEDRSERWWRTFVAPHKFGANFLYGKASRFGDAAATAALWLEPAGAEPLFPEEPKPKPETVSPSEAIAWIDPARWAGMPIPPREWLIMNVLPRREVSAIYGEGGVGKTLLAHQLAVHCAAGLPFLGQETRQERVLAFFCEDSKDELQRRHADILQAAGLEHYQTRDHLRVTSRRTQENRLAVWNHHARTMAVTPLWHEIRRDARQFGAGLLILDTLADIFGGEENDRAQVTSFVTNCLNRLAEETGSTVLVLAHPSASGASSGSGHSGSTAWNGKFRARLFLKRVKGVAGDVRELEGMKANYGPAGGKLKLRWERGAFSLVASSGLGPGASKIVPQLDDAAEQAVVAALQECAGEKLSAARNSPYFAPKVLKARAPEHLGDWSQADVQDAIERLMSRGAVQAAKGGRDASGHSISTLVLVEAVLKGATCGVQERQT